jgi:hypothetical protein
MDTPFTPDPFYASYPRILTNVFTKLAPRRDPSCRSALFSVLQALYRADPACFIITNGIHQNDETDTLHISVSVNCGYSCVPLHLYGYLKNAFMVTYITTMSETGVVSLVADFRLND